MIRVLALFLLLAGAGSAHAITIDFESATLGEGTGLTDQGFKIVGDGSVVDVGGDQKFGGSFFGACNFIQCGPVQISVVREDGGAFAFFGADVISGSNSGLETAGFYGEDADGNFVTSALGSAEWLNVVRVNFEIASFCSGAECGPSGQIDFDTLDLYVDNIQVQAVPIPAAVWLFGSALAGLGWLRRRPVS